MSKTWPLISIGEALTQVWRDEPVDPARDYTVLGARWYGGGLFIKDIKSGQEICAKSVYRVHEGDFVYNRLFAWKGSFAVATKDAHGAYVSNEFPCFTANPERLNTHFLWWYFRQESAWAKAYGLSTGATPTSRNRLKEEYFLKMIIPLPPLSEQRRIVAHIEELASQIHEAKFLRQKAAEETTILHAAAKQVMFEIAKMHGERPIEDCYDRIPNGMRYDKATVSESGLVPVISQSEDAFLGFHNDEPSVGKAQLPLVTFANHTCAVRFVNFPFSTIQNVFLLKPKSDIEPQYFFHFLHGRVPQMFYGGHWPNVSLLRLPVPPIEEQRRIVSELDALQAEVDRLKALQAETAAELDALLPSILDRAFKGEL